ncbi:MAG TPA: hypothetical protein VF177_22880 [Anaerolineae bacterium]
MIKIPWGMGSPVPGRVGEGGTAVANVERAVRVEDKEIPVGEVWIAVRLRPLL